jgi:hypothetical protein
MCFSISCQIQGKKGVGGGNTHTHTHKKKISHNHDLVLHLTNQSIRFVCPAVSFREVRREGLVSADNSEGL